MCHFMHCILWLSKSDAQAFTHLSCVCVIMILGATLCTTTLSMRVESNEFCYVYARYVSLSRYVCT